jgi:hypothetical protein
MPENVAKQEGDASCVFSVHPALRCAAAGFCVAGVVVADIFFEKW